MTFHMNPAPVDDSEKIVSLIFSEQCHLLLLGDFFLKKYGQYRVKLNWKHIKSVLYLFICRTFQVVRENGKFGFVIKGSNPAFIETIDADGPADKAGIKKGDFIIKLNGINVR